MLEVIVAIDCNNGIAKNDNIPWNNKTDMNFFRKKTLNNIVIMGSKTLLSLPQQKPLKNRLNIVITRNINNYIKKYKDYNNIIFFDEIMCKSFLENPKQYIETCGKPLEDLDYLLHDYKIYLIGGVQIIKLFINYCNILWITHYKSNYDCDLFINLDFTKYKKECILEDNELTIVKYSL